MRLSAAYPWKRLTFGMALASVLVAVGVLTPAGAAAADTGSTAEPRPVCFGERPGTFADGSTVWGIDWTFDVAECFGVAPSGTIWHTWQGTSKWHQMPGNGLATDMLAPIDWGNGDRTVQVFVGWSSWKVWCQNYLWGSGWTGRWFKC